MSISQSIASIIQQLAQGQAQIAMQKGQVNAGMIQGLAGIPAGIMGMKQDMADRSDYREDRELRRGSLQRAGEMQGLEIDQAKRHTAMQAEIQEAVSTISDPIERLTVTNQLVSQKYPEELPAFQAHVAKTLEPLKTGNPEAFHEAYGRITGNATDFNPTDPVLERQMALLGERDKQGEKLEDKKHENRKDLAEFTAGLQPEKAPNLSDTEVYADQMAQAHKGATGQDSTPGQRAKWMKDYRESSRAILQTGMSQFAGMQDGEAVIFKPTRGGGSLDTLKMPGQGPMQPKTEPADVRNQRMSFAKAEPVLGAISELSERINVNKGVVAKIVGGVEKVKAQANLNDDVAEYESLVSGFTPMIARAVGHVGVLTEQDVQSVRKLFPTPGDSKSLRDRKISRVKSILGGIQEQVGNIGNSSTASPQAAGPARIVQHNKKTGAYRHSEDGGKTWQPGQ